MQDDLIAAKEQLRYTHLTPWLGTREIPLFRPRSLSSTSGWRNVHGVGIGRKITAGVACDLLAVRVYVSRKFPERSVPTSCRISRDIDGVPTDVIAAPPPKFACTSARMCQQRPVIAGISASHQDVPFGTIACFCRSTFHEDAPDCVFVLSGNHVFGLFDAASLDSPLFQPGPREACAPADQEAFARFTRSVALQLDNNSVDAAIGRLEPKLRVNFRDEICSIGPINGSVVGEEALGVVKHGRTTGLTEGVITDASFDHILKHPTTGVQITFRNQLRIEATNSEQLFADEGDSGALVVRSNDHAAVGLLFAVGLDQS